MFEHEPGRAEGDDQPRVDLLLGLLRDLSRREPSSVLRERLSALASERLKSKPEDSGHLRGAFLPRVWLKPIFATALLIAIALIALITVHFDPKPTPADSAAKVSRPARPEPNGIEPGSALPPSVALVAKVRHRRPPRFPKSGTRFMTMQLPYSNGAIETGTNTFIWVSMSQSELLSLGFPLNATVQDRRFVAELVLGDDGLPRAINLPLPLEVTKEKQ